MLDTLIIDTLLNGTVASSFLIGNIGVPAIGLTLIGKIVWDWFGNKKCKEHDCLVGKINQMQNDLTTTKTNTEWLIKFFDKENR